MFCICENKDTDQLCGNHEADQCLCFRCIDSTIPLLSKSEISSLKLYSRVCVVLGRKPECWFSHDAAHIIFSQGYTQTLNKTACDCGCVTCAVGEFRCGNGQCIPVSLRCDGIIDCIDDEVGCGESLLQISLSFIIAICIIT